MPTGDPENIYYVDDHFEEDGLANVPAAYKASFPGNGGLEKVEVAPVPNSGSGNTSAKALYITDQGNATENAQSVSFFRQFESQKGTVIIDADFMLTEESGNAVLFQVKSYDDSKRAFSIGIRKPTAPENANKSATTIVYDNGSSSFYALSDEKFAQYKDKWQNIKLVLDVAAGNVTIYLNGKEIGTFDDYKDKDNFKKMGVGRIYSATAGGGTGTYYIDNLKVYVEPIASPKGLNAMPGNGAVQLEWPETPGALSYNVFRSESDGGPYTLIPATEEQPNPVLIPANRFVDVSVDNDKTYYYVITANSPTGESGYSNQAQAKPNESAAKPDAPAGLRATARNAQLELEWNAVPNAVSYELKRSSSASGPFETIMSKITDTSYRLGSVPNDESFYYVVSAKSVGGEGPNSEPISATAYAPPGTPKAVLHEGTGYIDLSWTDVGADSYIVKRAAKADGPFEIIADDIAAASFKDSEAAEGTPYYYKVLAVRAGVQGAQSAVVSGRSFNAGSGPEIPGNLIAESDDSKLHLTWTASDHAESYEVLRSTSKNGPFTVIASDIANNSYTDSGLINGEVYYYTVASRNAAGRSFATELVKAMPALVMTVAKDGSGDYATVQAAIDAAPDNGETPAVIRIKDGIYHEKVFVSASKKQVSIIGESRENTVITNGDTAHTIGPDGKELGTSNSYTVKVSGTDISLSNLTVKNSAGINDGQAVALYAEGDRGIYRNVKLLGFQDTLLADKGRSYFADSYIAGSVDFIFGNAPAVFNNSILHSAGPGYVTAASTAPGKPGYVFLNSRLTAEPGLTGKVDLGRPWRPDANVVFINAVMDDHIKPAGWNNWGNSENEKTARFREYGSQGTGANAAQRVNWSIQLTPEEAAQYAIEEVLGGTDGWNPEDERMLPDSNSTLADLNVNGIPVEGFSPRTKNYRLVLPEGMTDVPTLSAEPFSTAAEIVIIQAEEVEGTASARVTAMDGSVSLYTVRYELASEEEPAAVGITVDIPILTLEAGDSAQILATVQPKEADQSVSWSGGDPIIHVSETGLITGLKPGTARATVTSVTYSTYSTGVEVLVQDRKSPVWDGGQLTVSQVTKNSVTLNWQAAFDYVGVAKYAILINGKVLAEVVGGIHTYKVEGLSKGTAYEFHVVAYDGEQNGSSALKVTATTEHDNGNGNGNEIAEPFVSLGKDAFQVLEESSIDGAKAFRLVVDEKKFAQAWDEAVSNKTNKVVLNAAFIQNAAVKVELPLPLPAGSKGVTVTVQSEDGAYDLPAKLLHSMSGTAAILTISPINGQLLQLTESQANALGAKFIAAPIRFSLSAEVNGEQQSVSDASVYTRLTIKLPYGMDPNKATGVIVDSKTGELRFVPTKFFTENGITQAVLPRSEGNGVYAVIELSKSFPDAGSHWAEQDISLLASKLLVQGNAVGMFEPEREIRRAEFAALLVRSLGLSEKQPNEAFLDVSLDAWYAGSVAAAVHAGLMKGSGNGTFRPEDRISREEMVVMIARAAAFAGQENGTASPVSQSFSDYGDISDWAKDSVDWAAQAGLVNGLGDGNFAPGYETTRAQAVVIIKRMLQGLGFIN
ncbi:pectinesterase family protein [Paenibacillus sp. LHD-38]|uniref:pectinesterase family protein n=1 Tax=Paenibacillus sp. LHD-38 TaxID=3072143 RepID=UPI00280D390E|nr:pectinesterase family protein [Paenibacillus sp. LHD-38]MDQ8737268.1 pectinesterase family protein [Paenibacillus sp. LHD-38]